MVDRLRLFWNRPLQDGDRPRLFAVAVALIAGATAVLAQLDRPTPSPSSEAPARTTSPVPTPAPSPTAAPTATEDPHEEGTRSAGSANGADILASKRSARAFLAGYLPYTYGRGRAERIDAASAALRRRLTARRPRVPAGERRRTPRLELLQSDAVGGGRAELVALVADGRRRYTIALDLARTRGRWTVTGVGG